MEGPVRRVMRRAGFSSPAQIREALGISRQYEGVLNRAQLTELPNSVVNLVWKALRDRGFDLPLLHGEYREFQKGRRAFYGKKLDQIQLGPANGFSPIARLAEAVGSPGRLANWLCMHDFTINEYVKGTYSTPLALEDAIRESGWRWGESFIKACRQWDAEHKESK